jgi:DNA invertase Pin-like site-specific DNA recombinase
MDMVAEKELKKTAVVYMRVGRAAKADAEQMARQIEMQRQACLRIAAKLGCEVFYEFVDHGSTAAATNRPGLRMLFEWIEATPADFVITQDLARLSRRWNDLAFLERIFKGAGARLVTESTLADDDGREMEILLSIAAAYETDHAERIHKRGRTRAQSRTERDDVR